MRKLLLLALAAAFPLTASAQWMSQGAFPADTADVGASGIHGIAVDPDGQVYVQPFGNTATVDVPGIADPQNIRQIFVYEPDGSLADTITFLTNEDGTPGDTLGGFRFRNADGNFAWEGKSGRGLTTGPDGNIFVSQFDFLYELDYETDRVVNQVRVPLVRPGDSITAVSVTDDGTIYLREVFAVGPILAYNSDFEPIGNAIELTSDFARTIFATPDGNTILGLDYENPYAIRYTREDEFSAFDSTGVTLRGMRVESVGVNPATGNYWFSAGNNLSRPNEDAEGTQTWRANTWYAFTPESITEENPTPVDSLSWYECTYGIDDPVTTDFDESNLCYNDGALLAGRSRAIAFSPDGNTAYVGLFTQANAVAKYVRDGAAVEGRDTFAGALEQNRPNPFSGSTNIRFELDRAAQVSLRVYDTMGREVATLSDGAFAAGPHAVSFDAGSLAAGVYVYTLNVEGNVQTRRMMVVR